jgi:hypothetical protein
VADEIQRRSSVGVALSISMRHAVAPCEIVAAVKPDNGTATNSSAAVLVSGSHNGDWRECRRQ